MKFILSKELGKLATWLRILGFDSVYYKQDRISSLIILALKEDRVILTRNHYLPKHTGIRIIVVDSERVNAQLKEVLKALNIKANKDIMFSRCVICNILLSSIEKTKIESKVPEYVFATQEKFLTCEVCNRIYWKGTHWGNVEEIIEGISRE